MEIYYKELLTEKRTEFLNYLDDEINNEQTTEIEITIEDIKKVVKTLKKTEKHLDQKESPPSSLKMVQTNYFECYRIFFNGL